MMASTLDFNSYSLKFPSLSKASTRILGGFSNSFKGEDTITNQTQIENVGYENWNDGSDHPSEFIPQLASVSSSISLRRQIQAAKIDDHTSSTANHLPSFDDNERSAATFSPLRKLKGRVSPFHQNYSDTKISDRKVEKDFFQLSNTFRNNEVIIGHGDYVSTLKASSGNTLKSNLSALKPKNVNVALLLIKPVMNSSKINYVITSVLEERGFRIREKDKYTGEEIASNQIYDKFYNALSKHAFMIPSKEIALSSQERAEFHLGSVDKWDEVARSHKMINAIEACSLYQIDHDALYEMWKSTKQIRLGKGFHVARFHLPDKSKTSTEGGTTTTVSVQLTDTVGLNNQVFVDPSQSPQPTKSLQLASVPVTATRKQKSRKVISTPLEECIYVANGFYKSMRDLFLRSNSVTTCMVIEWDGNECSWADFLSEVIGDREPSLASPQSIRGMMYRDWEKLGLPHQPTLRDNCIHASRSAFEGLFDRMIWVRGASIETDSFGCQLLADDIPQQLIQKYLSNPLMKNGNYIFDELLKQSSDYCLAYLKKINQATNLRNQQSMSSSAMISKNPIRDEILSGSREISVIATQATSARVNSDIEYSFLIIKPTANTSAVIDLIQATLLTWNIRVKSTNKTNGTEVQKRGTFDKLFKRIRHWAEVIEDPSEIPLETEALKHFKKSFNTDWQKVLKEGKIHSWKSALSFLGVSNEELYKRCMSDVNVRLTKNIYCARIRLPETINSKFPASRKHMDKLMSLSDYTKILDEIDALEELRRQPDYCCVYIINGFFGSMRDTFISPQSITSYMILEWDSGELSWSEFLKNVVGDRNPSIAALDSIRHTIHQDWQKLGLSQQPDLRDNCIHASRSAFEGLFDRLTWAKGSFLFADPYGSQLLNQRFQSEHLINWLTDPIVEDHKHLFHLMRGKSGEDCMKYLRSLIPIEL